MKWFNEQKGYGFLTAEEGGEDLFFHHSAIQMEEGFKTILTGEKVSFDVEQGKRGLQACNVKKI